MPVLPAASHMVFTEFPAYCGAFLHAAYKDSPLRALLAEIDIEYIAAALYRGEISMNRNVCRTRMLAVVGALLVCGLLFGVVGQLQAEVIRHSTAGDLFYNHYVPPVGGGVGVQLYPCPRPTPPLVGHTYITYQPLMPSEFLYKHKRIYRTVHEDAPPTRTSVRWGRPIPWP
jgi:hypothetical protein